MKMLVIGDEMRVRKYLPKIPIVQEVELVVVKRGTPDEEIVRQAGDADVIMADAISPVSQALIQAMPNLKLIHSEGVAYNAIDVTAATERGVIVCNNAGVNASAVAEQAILLMLACLRNSIYTDAAVRAGRQIQTKEAMMVNGFRELGDCTVGFIGFGAIAQATAKRLSTWGCTMLYNKRHPLDAASEEALGVTFADQSEIIRRCDIISLHTPVTPETKGLVNAAFLKNMRSDAILINTARGEIIDQEALVNALEEGTIAMAGLDVLCPEPVTRDNPLLNLSPEASRRLVLSPHIGGVTEGMFHRAHRMVWENVARLAQGEEPVRIVNRPR